MAHLGEAQGVIETFNLRRVSPHLFESEELSCLITGEGPFEAATSTAALLGGKKFSAVINLGIAGALSRDFAIGEIYPVRSVYLIIDNRPQFKSFKSSEKGLDCLTSFERILHPEKALPLSGIGHLVDREAWGVAMAAKNFNIPFSSFKLISDVAGTLGACELTMDMAQEWSQKLALYLNELLNIKSEAPTLQRSLPGFHFTFSTRHQFEHMLEMISRRDDRSPEAVLSSLPLKELNESVSHAKERTRLLLELMEGRLDPLKLKLRDGLSSFKAPFERQGITLQHDSSWESPELKVSFSVSSKEDLEKKLSTLEALDLSPFQQLRNGSFHVE